MVTVTPCLMFDGQAKEAIALYLEAFSSARLTVIDEYSASEGIHCGRIKTATISLEAFDIRLIDSPVTHGFAFTPAVSLYVEMTDEAALFHAFATLSKLGTVLLPLDTYPHSPSYGWLTDKFGVSWQLSQPEKLTSQIEP